jgi:O-6-methylguanine DNA methyltransferase
MFYSVFETVFGTAVLVSGGSGIRAFYMPDKRRNIIKKLKKDFPEAVMRRDADIREAEALLKRYFSGEKVSFNMVRIDLAGLSPFTLRVLNRTACVPYGALRTYLWAGSGKARPAGGALGSNPVPVLIPCHRIIRSNGSIGGFSAGTGWKKRLLKIEGIEVRQNSSKQKI